MLIKVSSDDWINPDHICRLSEWGNGTQIYLTDGKQLIVSASVDEIISMINEAKGATV